MLEKLERDLFVFTDMGSCNGRLKLNSTKDGIYHLYFDKMAQNDNGDATAAADATGVENAGATGAVLLSRDVFIDPRYIADGNVAMAMYLPLTDELIVHYGYSQLCESMNMTHSEFLSITNNCGLMQLDRYKNKVFIKVFLPKGQYSLDSDTDDYSDNAYLTADCCLPLDWQYIPTYDLINAKIEDNKLYLTLGVCRPVMREAQGNMHINYAGQCVDIIDGERTYVFDFVKGENAYIGYPYSRRKGRMIDIERAVMLCIK